jgi:hypothetical protein
VNKRQIITGVAAAVPVLASVVWFASRAATAQDAQSTAERIAALEQGIAAAKQEIQRVHDRDDVEILARAYGYYLDKSLWDPLADLFAADGAIEIGTRGTYIGRERIRKFLHTAYGAPGPKEGVISNHIQLQPVIHVADDGLSAKARIRLLFQTGRHGQGASWGGGIYENEYVKRDGIWQIKRVKTYTTFVADYEGGWTKSPKQAISPPSKEFPPDVPPGPIVESYPNVYELPFHYDNPVTGRKN